LPKKKKIFQTLLEGDSRFLWNRADFLNPIETRNPSPPFELFVNQFKYLADGIKIRSAEFVKKAYAALNYIFHEYGIRPHHNLETSVKETRTGINKTIAAASLKGGKIGKDQQAISLEGPLGGRRDERVCAAVLPEYRCESFETVSLDYFFVAASV
jgi:hypothetical protein